MKKSLFALIVVLAFSFTATSADAQYWDGYGCQRSGYNGPLGSVVDSNLGLLNRTGHCQFFSGYGMLGWYPYGGVPGGGYWGQYNQAGRFNPMLYGNGQPMSKAGKAEVAVGFGSTVASSFLHRSGRHGWGDVAGIVGQLLVVDGMRRRQQPQYLLPPQYVGNPGSPSGRPVQPTSTGRLLQVKMTSGLRMENHTEYFAYVYDSEGELREGAHVEEIPPRSYKMVQPSPSGNYTVLLRKPTNGFGVEHVVARGEAIADGWVISDPILPSRPQPQLQIPPLSYPRSYRAPTRLVRLQ